MRQENKQVGSNLGKNLVSQFAEYFAQNEEFRRRALNYTRMIESEEFKFYQDSLLSLKGVMANDMFSRSHTSLSAEEKDIIQRTYYNIDQILTFLSNPLNWVKKRSSKWNIIKQMEGKENG
jgi:hypothetical protein